MSRATSDSDPTWLEVEQLIQEAIDYTVQPTRIEKLIMLTILVKAKSIVQTKTMEQL